MLLQADTNLIRQLHRFRDYNNGTAVIYPTKLGENLYSLPIIMIIEIPMEFNLYNRATNPSL